MLDYTIYGLFVQVIWLFIGLGYGIQDHRINMVRYHGLHTHKHIAGWATSLA
jgi:hypothetical protein